MDTWKKKKRFPEFTSLPLRRNLMGMFPMVDGDGTFLICGDWKNLLVLIGFVVVSWVRHGHTRDTSRLVQFLIRSDHRQIHSYRYEGSLEWARTAWSAIIIIGG
jgi:hypothetical protein